MKKSLTRKLTIAVIALVFAVVSLSTSTYAWFTMSNDADVEAFTADVKAGQGIEIAVTTDGDDTNAQWYTGVIPQTVIQTVVPTGFKFDAVTTNESAAEFKKLDANSKAIEAATANTDYITFWVHIKAAKAGKIQLNGITWVLDTTDALVYEKHFYYLINNPDVNCIRTKEETMAFPDYVDIQNAEICIH